MCRRKDGKGLKAVVVDERGGAGGGVGVFLKFKQIVPQGKNECELK